jgi:hypothetical protein
MTKDQENIEKEPSTGGKAVRGFGYVLLGIGILVSLATFTIGVARNLSVLVLVTLVLFIVFSLLLMRVGRTNKEEKASWLSYCGIQSEIINMLQGRTPRSVFSRHYLTLKLDYRDKVLQALDKLRRDIER